MNPSRIPSLLLLLILPLAAVADHSAFIVVLGVAQDAGYPQANCYKPHCNRAWENADFRRMASSIAVVDNRIRKKYLFDATPDLRNQLYELHRIAPDEDFELAGVFLTHGHIGHYTGLMHFGHEASGATGVPVYTMPRMRDYLSTNGPWSQLVNYRNIELIDMTDGNAVLLPDVSVTPFLVPHRDEYTETVGFRIEGPNKSALYLPDIDKWGRWTTDIRELVKSVDYALLDATFFADGELPGRKMEDIKHPFVEESMRLFSELSEEDKARIIFIHFNHSNPLLIDGSDAQEYVIEQGYRFAQQGMRLPL